jgi:hypothetical protein
MGRHFSLAIRKPPFFRIPSAPAADCQNKSSPNQTAKHGAYPLRHMRTPVIRYPCTHFHETGLTQHKELPDDQSR